jgi:hypothetical protein
MRIACYYESRLHRNDGNPLYVWNSLKKRQAKNELEVDHLVPTDTVRLLGSYDAHIWVDWGEDALVGMLPYTAEFPKRNGKDPVVYWASDTHLGYDHRLMQALKSDIVFVAQKDAVERMKADGVPNPIWLPHAIEPQAYPKFNLAAKTYDVGFVGHVSSDNRIEALDRLFKEFPNFFYGQRLFDEAARKYNECKICFNIAMKDDVNMRCFEVMGCGGFLMTDRVQSIDELMTDGKHCAIYTDINDMIEKAHYYLEHDEEREAISKAGYEHAMAKHTIDHRVDVILEEIKKFKEQSK